MNKRQREQLKAWADFFDEVFEAQDEPQEGKTYALIAGPGTPCIANGDTWADSEVPPHMDEATDNPNPGDR